RGNSSPLIFTWEAGGWLPSASNTRFTSCTPGTRLATASSSSSSTAFRKGHPPPELLDWGELKILVAGNPLSYDWGKGDRNFSKAWRTASRTGACGTPAG